jgi:hypothetical protein
MSNSPIPFADGGPRIIANGYEPLAVELSEIALGHLQPTGPWAFGQDVRTIHAEAYASGVLAAKLPIEGTDFDACRARWCAGIRIETDREDVAEAVSAMVQRIAGAGPVQLSDKSPSRLHVFRIEATDARHFSLQTQRYRTGQLSVEAVGTCWLLQGAGLRWKDGVSLLDVPRAGLPLLTEESASEIIRLADDGLAKLQPPAPKTALQLRMEAAVAHRVACGTCVVCAGGAAVGDWVKLDRSDLAQIVADPAGHAVPNDAGEYHILYAGKAYRAHGHRLVPATAPVVEPKPQKRTLMIGARYTVEVSEDAAS